MTQKELPADAGARQGAQAVIYAFRSPGSGAVYIGKHKCDCAKWPKRGKGALPDGYKGSGRAVRRFHERHGEAVEWRVLALVAAERDVVNAAEKRAIRIARRALGRKCANMTEGGDGFTSERSTALWPDPKKRQQISATHKALAQTPDRAAYLERAAEMLRDPEIVARRLATRAKWDASPEGRAYLAQAAAALQAPEIRAKRVAASKAFAATESGRAAIATFVAAAATPEARAKAVAKRKLYDATPEGKAKRLAAGAKAAAVRARKKPAA